VVSDLVSPPEPEAKPPAVYVGDSALRAREMRLRYLDYVTGDALAMSATTTPETAAKLRRETWQLADDLAGPTPSPIERSLAETAALAWLAMRIAEYQGAHESRYLHREHYEKLAGRIHRRYTATIKTLAAVRRAAAAPTVAVQVNNQVNVGGPAPAVEVSALEVTPLEEPQP
jgi:hypothetical protein